jgi:hypothetical protein
MALKFELRHPHVLNQYITLASEETVQGPDTCLSTSLSLSQEAPEASLKVLGP